MTKRLFAYIGLTMLLTFTVVFYFGFYGAIFAAVFSAALIILAFVLKFDKRSVYILVCSVILASTLYFEVYAHFFEIRSEVYDNQTVGLSAVVKNSPHLSYDMFCYELESVEINENEESLKILLKSSYDLNLEYADRLDCNATLTKCDNNYYRSKGFTYIAEVPEEGLDYSARKTEEKGIGYLPVFLRERFTHAVSVLMPGSEGELCNAIVFGDKFGLSRSLYNSFTDTGLSYIIVVSGMHMSIIAACILMLFKPFSRRRGVQLMRMIVTSAFILLYMSITGFSSSVVRSGVMIILTLGELGVNRKGEIYNRLGFAAIFLTLLNPFAVGDVGLLLSFASVSGIVYLQPKMNSWLEKKTHLNEKLVHLIFDKDKTLRSYVKLYFYKFIRYIFEIFTTSLAAVIATSPITLMLFGVCNPLVIIFSQLIVPVMHVLMICTILAAVLWYVPLLNCLSYTFAFAAFWIAKWTIGVVDFAAKLPFGRIFASPVYMQLWLAAVLVILAAAMLFRNRRKSVSVGVFLSVALLAVGYSVNLLLNADDVKLNVLNAGNGTTVWLSSAEGNDILSCGGSMYERSAIFETIRVDTRDIDFLLVPAASKRECAFAADFLSEFDVKGVLLYYRYNTSENAYRRAEKLDNFDTFSEEDSVTVNLINGFTDHIVNVKNHTWQYLDCGNKSVIIAPSGGKLWEIPDDFRKADFIILNEYIQDIETLECTFIWSSRKPVPAELSGCASTADSMYTIDLK